MTDQKTSADSPIAACLWFDDQGEEAARFYVDLFDGTVTATTHYPESIDNPSGRPRGSVLTAEFEVCGQRFTALNGGPDFEINPSISFFAEVEDPAEVDRLHAVLAEGGEDLMPLDSYPWSERYAWVQDRFGVSWQLMAGRSGPTKIYPCLMFSGERHGRAEEAIHHYTEIFGHSNVEQIDRYTADEGPEGTIKHGRFTIEGQTLVVMDSHIEHGFTFDEGVSLVVTCSNQAAIDYYWGKLTDGGAPGQCGWLRDRFGVAWQVVPADIAEILGGDDPESNTRAFQALLEMTKLDVGALRAAAHDSKD